MLVYYIKQLKLSQNKLKVDIFISRFIKSRKILVQFLHTLFGMNISISPQNIIEAFKVISINQNNQSIAQANNYLYQCQKSPKFPFILLNLYELSSEQYVQLQSLLLLLNTIKRNWQSKRGRSSKQQLQNFQNEKPLLRKQILRIYPFHNMSHVRHINQILKFLSRQDYPVKYVELHNFMLQSLKELLSVLSSSQIVQHKHFIVSFLSTVKIAMKQYANKRLSHTQEAFTQYISQIVKVAYHISIKLNQLIAQWLNNNDQSMIEMLLESAKKTEKIILYCLQSMPNSMQYISQVQQIFETILLRLQHYNKILCSNGMIGNLIQGYISGVLQQVSKLQSLYPFLLTSCLQRYLQLILQMLIQQIPQKYYSSQRLIITIIQSNLKIFTCFTYYMNQKEFSQTIYNRKNPLSNAQVQKNMHRQFRNVFTKQNVQMFLSKIIIQVMTSKQVAHEDKGLADQELVLQQKQVAVLDVLADCTAYEVCILLCKNIVKCFKNQVKPILQGLFISVGNFQTSNNTLKQKIIQNSMQLILVLPKIYDENQLPINEVMSLLTTLYNNRQYSMLARLIKNYNEFLSAGVLESSFNVLGSVVSTSLSSPYVSIDIIYQSALTMKKILEENQNQLFSFQNSNDCIVNLLTLLKQNKFTNTPTLMWPLIKLANQLLKLITPNIVIETIGQKIIHTLTHIIQKTNNDEMTVCGVTQIVQNLMNIMCGGFKIYYLEYEPNKFIINQGTIKLFYAAYTLIINNLKNKNMQSIDSLHLLWLCLIRNYPTLNQQSLYQLNQVPQITSLNNSLTELFNQMFDSILEQSQICAIQLLEEYIILGIVTLTENQLYTIFQKLLTDCQQEHKIRTYTALFSLYYSYLIVNQQHHQHIQLSTDILKLIMNTLIAYCTQISPQINGLRTLIMIIINFCIIKFGAQNMYPLFNSFYEGNFNKWFYAYFWSAQYVSSRLCHKINSSAYLSTIKQLSATTFSTILMSPIQQQFPLDTVLKTLLICLQPLKPSICITTLSNMYKLILPTQSSLNPSNKQISRKIKLQLSGLIRQVLVSDQRDNYRELIGEVFKIWDWAEDDLLERFDKHTAQEIIMLLKGQYQHNNQYNVADQN